jgi:hypothetical protein
MIEINTNPTRRDLAIFGLIFLLFFALIGAMAFKPQPLVVIACVLTCAVAVSLIFNDTLPRARQLLGLMMPVAFGLIGGFASAGAPPMTVAIVVWSFGAALAVLIWIAPAPARMIYIGWMSAAEPIGWTMTNLILAIVYYLVLTPVALLMRLMGRDPMQRKLDPSATTYWIERQPPSDMKQYFKQF